MQCIRTTLFTFLFIIFNAALISLKFDAPVDKIIGFFFEAMASINGKLVISEEEILKTFNKGFKKLTDSKSNGVDKNSIFLFLQ